MGYALLLISFSFSKSTTETALDASEIVILLCGLVLAVGAAGEYTEEHGTLPIWMRWSRRPKMVFVWMVALSLVGEFVGDAGVFVFSGHLQTINDGEYAALNKEAGLARKDAGDANREAAKLRIRAEELEEQILELGPRDLLLYGKREETLVNSLRQFKGQKVQVRICVFANNEVRDTAERLTALFKIAEWTVSPHSPDWGESNCLLPPNLTSTGLPPSGIWVGTPSATPSGVTRGRVRKLVEFLSGVPLLATLHTVRPETVRAGPDRTSIQGRYDDPESIVVVVLSHSFERAKPPTPTVGGIVF